MRLSICSLWFHLSLPLLGLRKARDDLAPRAGTKMVKSWALSAVVCVSEEAAASISNANSA